MDFGFFRRWEIFWSGLDELFIGASAVLPDMKFINTTKAQHVLMGLP
jgi:hypothetical protein